MGSIRSYVRRHHLGLVAIFIALSGTAYAATELERNEVRSKHLKNRGVKSKDVANDAITSPKVLNGSLLSDDFAPGHLPQGPPGEQGPPGVKGEQGIQGERGPSGIANVVQRTVGSGIATCAAGERLIGGGARALGDDYLRFSHVGSVNAAGTPITWEAASGEHPGMDGDGVVSGATAYALCAAP